MKKLLFTIFCITQIGFILVYPTEALKAAREGLNLWLNVMIPTLLPFLICTGILVQTRPDQPVAGTVQNVMENCFWHISCRCICSSGRNAVRLSYGGKNNIGSL